jgi:hemerythrin-like metal-binding protein
MQHLVKEALQNELFVLYYQPKIDLKTKKVLSAEALIRIQKPDGTIIYPNDFIPIAEKNGDIVEIDKWVFKKLINDARYIYMLTKEDINISFNISTYSFLEDDFLENLSNIFNLTTDFFPKFEMEITEYSSIKDINKTISNMQKLKKMGLKISLDDFGIGHASLSHLSKLPIDCIKIDKSFIDMIEIDEKTTSIVDTILYLAKKLGLKTVAEGVEKTNQVIWLKDHGCDEIQGYYYSKPLPIKKFTMFVKAINKRDNVDDSFIIWGKKYSTGHYAFDTQHMIIASILNNIYFELKSNKELTEVNNYFSILEDYIQVHFKAEEDYMRDTNYKDIKIHAQAHKEFKNLFYNFKKNLSSSKRDNNIKLFKILREWFIKHEMGLDKKFINSSTT